MHSGPLVILRMWLLYARPWQQLLICLTFVLAGVALVALLGHPSGAILAVCGVLFAIPVLRRLPRARDTKHQRETNPQAVKPDDT